MNITRLRPMRAAIELANHAPTAHPTSEIATIAPTAPLPSSNVERIPLIAPFEIVP